MTLTPETTIRLLLCGDVMTGRGIDQVLPHPGSQVLYEIVVRDAREYVQLAERAHGHFPRPVGYDYIWGEALAERRRAEADLWIANLETSITCSEDPWPDKGIHYRMHPRNVDCITAAGIDCACLANNHVMDWGRAGLAETIRTLDSVGVAHAGAGRNALEAALPAPLDVRGKGRVLVYSFGSVCSGIPEDWAATPDLSGVNLLKDLSDETAQDIVNRISLVKRPDDIAIVSIHWGGNWGYDITPKQTRFAHRLVDGGVDIVHGHSSHHVKAVEIYREHLVLYGCGDFLTDYEGIGGHESFRGELALMYLADIVIGDGRLAALRLVPFQMRQFRLKRAGAADARFLCDLLHRLGAEYQTVVETADDNSLIVPCG